MRNSRLAVAVVAATSVAVSALTPVAATAQVMSSPAQLSSGGYTNTEGFTEECKEAVEQEREEHEQAVEDGTAGSSFMGPQELAFGIANGYGSSGMPDDPDCIEEEEERAEDEQWEQVPDSLQSMRGNDTTDLIFAVVGGILAVGASVTQAATILAAFSPDVRDQIRTALEQAGFHF
ncbi:hypothetical protein ACG98H_02070 [Corynebacterium sp. L4756]|uniref:hypothetical protein n=1 Tax=unclassified Corynebacterium TaxID=2624378 RepID=UPI00374D03BC